MPTNQSLGVHEFAKETLSVPYGACSLLERRNHPKITTQEKKTFWHMSAMQEMWLL